MCLAQTLGPLSKLAGSEEAAFVMRRCSPTGKHATLNATLLIKDRHFACNVLKVSFQKVIKHTNNKQVTIKEKKKKENSSSERFYGDNVSCPVPTDLHLQAWTYMTESLNFLNHFAVAASKAGLLLFSLFLLPMTTAERDSNATLLELWN